MDRTQKKVISRTINSCVRIAVVFIVATVIMSSCVGKGPKQDKWMGELPRIEVQSEFINYIVDSIIVPKIKSAEGYGYDTCCFYLEKWDGPNNIYFSVPRDNYDYPDSIEYFLGWFEKDGYNFLISKDIATGYKLYPDDKRSFKLRIVNPGDLYCEYEYEECYFEDCDTVIRADGYYGILSGYHEFPKPKSKN